MTAPLLQARERAIADDRAERQVSHPFRRGQFVRFPGPLVEEEYEPV